MTAETAPPIISGDTTAILNGLLMRMTTRTTTRAETIAPTKSNGGLSVAIPLLTLFSSRTTKPRTIAIAIGMRSTRKIDCHGRNCRITPATIGPAAIPMATIVV